MERLELGGWGGLSLQQKAEWLIVRVWNREKSLEIYDKRSESLGRQSLWQDKEKLSDSTAIDFVCFI